MADDGIKLFDTKANDLIMPSIGDNSSDTGANLMSEGLERAISGETVKSLMIPEDIEIALPNYVIDLTKCDTICEFHMEGIDALFHPDGDTTVYAYTQGGLVKLRRGLSDILDRVMPIAISTLFSSKADLYRDFKPGDPLQIVSEKDITTMKLSI